MLKIFLDHVNAISTQMIVEFVIYAVICLVALLIVITFVWFNKSDECKPNNIKTEKSLAEVCEIDSNVLFTFADLSKRDEPEPLFKELVNDVMSDLNPPIKEMPKDDNDWSIYDAPTYLRNKLKVDLNPTSDFPAVI